MTFENGQFGRRNLHFNNHWEPLDIDNYKITRPTLICLGGNGTIDPAKATRFCATAERLVGLKIDDTESSYKNVDLVGFHYTPSADNPSIGSFDNEQRNKIVALFLNLCVDENNNPLPIQAVAKNFSMINIFSHCWGAREISQIGMSVERQMHKLGFSKDQVGFALNQIFHVSYAPFTNHTSFPMLRINSFVDHENYGLKSIYKSTYGKDLNGVSLHYDPAGYFRKEPSPFTTVPIISLYSSQLINVFENSDLQKITDEHGVDVLERNPNWTQGHQSRNAKNADLVSKITGYTLANMMANSIINKNCPQLIEKENAEDLYNSLCAFKLDYSNEDLETKISNPTENGK